MLNLILKLIVCLILGINLRYDLNAVYAKDDKLRVCIVEGRGTYKKTTINCPMLEQTSNIECVIGVDRLDCLRRIHKGSAHFGVFSSEDLVAARWAGVEILITNELRYHKAPFEYEIVAIVDNEANINSAQELKGSKFCHPGHGLQSHWTDVLANYFESTLVPRQCDEDISLIETRIKASADFFGPSCKAGPWVPDTVQDQILKRRYPSLCELCYNPQTCGMGDKHWGRRGPLYCLTGGYGDVAWVRLDDAKSHFGFLGLPAQSDPNEYSFLCPDGHLQPLTTQSPCVWVAKPWPAIAAQRQHANHIQGLIQQISHNEEQSWENALLNLLETYHVNITTLDVSVPIEDYLNQAVGYQSAYNFAACSPSRSIIYCTTSLIEHFKCSWLQEAATVYGIEPNLQCIRAESINRCMDDTMNNVADVVLVNQDQRIQAERDFHLKPLLYEYALQMHERYQTVAVVRNMDNDNNIHLFDDLKGHRACFPEIEGAAYLSVWETLRNLSLITVDGRIEDFFLESKIIDDQYRGDLGALRCLSERKGSVAFISSGVFKNYTSGQVNATWVQSMKKIKLLCPYGLLPKHENEPCYLHWTVRGHLMVNNNTKLIRKNEIYNSFRYMDTLFGKQYKSHTIPFTMFGPFDRKNNVMFLDTTDGLKGLPELEKDKLPRFLESSMNNYLRVHKTRPVRTNGSYKIENNLVLVIYLVIISQSIRFWVY